MRACHFLSLVAMWWQPFLWLSYADECFHDEMNMMACKALLCQGMRDFVFCSFSSDLVSNTNLFHPIYKDEDKKNSVR